MKCLRTFLLAACVAATAGDAARTAPPERLVLYVDENLPGADRLVDDIGAGLVRSGAAARHSIRLEVFHADVASEELLREQLRNALARAPSAIIASNSNVAIAAKDLTTEVPIIFGSHQDPIAVRLARSLANPGGNLTGFTYFVPVHEKRLELLRAVAPGARKLGVVIDRWWLAENGGRAAVEAARAKLGFEVSLFTAETVDELSEALASRKARDMQAWYVPMTRLAYEHPEAVAGKMQATSRPVMFPATEFVDRGGLIAYQQLMRRDEVVGLLAKMIGLVLDGIPAGEIPVERPKAFELAVNAAAAQRLGIPLPDNLLKRANRVVTSDVPQ